MTVDGPLGDFTLEADYNCVFLAAGIGITPMRGLLKQLEGLNYTKEATLVHAEHRQFYCFVDDFSKMKNVNVKYEKTGENMKSTAAILDDVRKAFLEVYRILKKVAYLLLFSYNKRCEVVI